MKNYTIHYKDHLGRKNRVSQSAKDNYEAESKFRVLYPDCSIVETVEN